MPFPGSSDFPASVDPAEVRADNVDIAFARDVNFLSMQVNAIEQWAKGREIVHLRTGRYDYLQGGVPDHEVSLGGFVLDTAKLHGSSVLRARCMINPTLSVPGYTRIHIDDFGAVGAPAAPVRITGVLPSTYALESTASGLVVLMTDAFDVGTGAGYPGVGKIAQGNRMYGIVVLQTSVLGDTVDVSFAELVEET